MRKSIIAGLALVALTLTGCYQSGSRGESEEIMISFSKSVRTFELPDGRTVLCLLGSHGSMDCDWNNAK